MFAEHDLITRQVRQLAMALARLLRRGSNRSVSEAQAQLEAAYPELLGLDKRMLEQVDETSLGMLLDKAGALEAYLWLLEQEAALCERCGKADDAERLRLRSKRLQAHSGAVPLSIP